MTAEVPPESSAFAQDRNTPLDIREAGCEKLQGATLHDRSFANPAAARVSAYPVQPKPVAVCPAILFLHWGQGNRTTFFSEALAYDPLRGSRAPIGNFVPFAALKEPKDHGSNFPRRRA